MASIDAADEYERLALIELFSAGQAGDPDLRRRHLDQAAVYAAKAERARGGDRLPR